MSLNSDLSKIDNWQELLDEQGNVGPLTEKIIYGTMLIGINEIANKKSALEFTARVRLVELVYRHPHPLLALADVQRHIGLKTNVGPLTRMQFITQRIWPKIEDVLQKEGKP